MTLFETVIRHIAEGVSYSWDLTILLGLGLVLSETLRRKLIQGRTSSEEAAYVTALYTRRQLDRRHGRR